MQPNRTPASTSPVTRPVVVIGMNLDTALDLARLKVLISADIIYTSPRHRDLITKQRPNLSARWHMWQSPLDDSLKRIEQDHHAGKSLVVIASGDPMCYGIGATIIRHFPDLPLKVIPAPSSFSLATAALKWPAQNCTCISLHCGEDHQILQYLPPRQPLLCLTKNQHSPQLVALILDQQGWGASKVTVLEELGNSTERVRPFTAQKLANEKLEFQHLNMLAIVPGRSDSAMVEDDIFPLDHTIVHDGQLTKFAFRAITLATLNPAPKRVLWDIGAGSGAISLGWIKLGGHALAIEQHPQRSKNILQNTKFIQAPLFELYQQSAESILHDFARHDTLPDAIFFGGALALIETAMPMLKSRGTLVANAVTVASQQHLSTLHQQHGGNLRRINIEEEDSIAGNPALKPARSVLQYWWHKP
ncbi:MAG: precorrin-6y C5,15-methyltransferase (decarboxylating) subunit CbiE [Alphaproteobacteria bacterium]|nr:precorrin-6y C5,15-methyltransferase (decarboxylating) subunit CbiE [Alphaproteobacteria bacterium]